MLLPPLALPHPPALPHHHRRAHPLAPATPGLALLNHIDKSFINILSMLFASLFLPVRVYALIALACAMRAAARPRARTAARIPRVCDATRAGLWQNHAEERQSDADDEEELEDFYEEQRRAAIRQHIART